MIEVVLKDGTIMTASIADVDRKARLLVLVTQVNASDIARIIPLENVLYWETSEVNIH